jgi:nucleotide-binding universal stress UspA family protein
MKDLQRLSCNFLVYTDGSPQSAEAVRSAARLVKAGKGRLDVLTVADPLPYKEEAQNRNDIPTADWPSLPAGLEKLAMGILPLLVEEGLTPLPQTLSFREEPDNRYSIRLTDVNGQPLRLWVSYTGSYDAITQLTEEADHDMVVVSASSSGLLGRILGKDLTSKLALNLPTSLLVVKEPVHVTTPFVLCSDGSDSSRRAFGALRRLVPLLKSSVHILINEGQDPTPLHAWLDKRHLAGHVMTMPADLEDPAGEIIRIVHPGQVLVLGASLRATLAKKVQGSVPQEIIRRGGFSVLLSKELPDGEDTEF